jgi:methylisocitrate lyase
VNRFAALLGRDAATVVPACHDALSARVAEVHGFEAAAVSGYDAGAALGVTEPLLTASEVVAVCTQIRRTTAIPLLVDVGAGFGEPLHAARAVQDLALVGVEAVQIEDQVYPKRAHYFNDYDEQLISLEAMLAKLHAVRRAVGDAVALVARTDAFAVADEKEALRRVEAFAEAGADAVMAFPRTVEEATRLPRAVDAPVVYVNTHGNRVGRPALSARAAGELGYAAVVDAHTLLFAGFTAMEEAAARLARDDPAPEAIGVRRRVEEVLRVDELLAIEAQTPRPRGVV